MKKIGIITFHRAINFGGVLQTYALHKYLENIGIESEVIDYRCEKIEQAYKPIQKTGNIVKNSIRLLTVTPLIYKKNLGFHNFIDKNIKLSKPLYSKGDLNSIQDEYYSFITGSDQVFTYNWSGFDDAYFLNFVSDSSKKNSYAASFGTNSIPEEYVSRYKNYLNYFNKFSVREESAKAIINDLIGRNSDIHIDPTFLISKKEWKDICVKVKHDNYLLLYTLGIGNHVQELIDEAQRIAKERNLKILYINDKYYKSNNHIKYISGASPEYFVSLFDNANYVVTNSFHGTAFSIIMNKEFITSSNMPNGLGTRIENILELLNLNDRDFGKCKTASTKKNIDWDDVNKNIEEQRNRSKEYLLSI